MIKNQIPLLLSSPSACLRYLVHKELLFIDDSDDEVRKLNELRFNDPILKTILSLQNADGSFKRGEYTSTSSDVIATSVALVKLSFLGFDNTFKFVNKAIEFLLSTQNNDGSWSLPATKEQDVAYDMIPLQTAIPLWGLAAVGFSCHKNSEKAYDWLAERQLSDGTWPTGIAQGNYGYIAQYRKLPDSIYGCRVNTTACLLPFSLHPERKSQAQTIKGIDRVLNYSKFNKGSFGYFIARFVNAEPSKGFFTFFENHDVALFFQILRQVNIVKSDDRVAKLFNKIFSLQNENDLWIYDSFPLVSHWLTYDLIKSDIMIRHA